MGSLKFVYVVICLLFRHVGAVVQSDNFLVFLEHAFNKRSCYFLYAFAGSYNVAECSLVLLDGRGASGLGGKDGVGGKWGCYSA